MSQSESRKQRRQAYRERVRKVKKYHRRLRKDPELQEEIKRNMNNENNIS